MGLEPAGLPRGRARRARGRAALSPRSISRDDLGAWLLKASGASAETRAHAAGGFTAVASRCVRPSYRTALVRPGDRVLLWVSGAQRDLPAGIHATGWVTGPVVDDRLPVRLGALEHPVTRGELLGHPDLASLEVLRMPAGSNPSWVTRAQLAALDALGTIPLGQDPASEWRGLSGFSSELR